MEGEQTDEGPPPPALTEGEVEARARSANTFVLGLTGPFGSGCTTAAHMLAEGDPPFTKVKLSDVLRTLGGDGSRGSLQDLGNTIRQQEGNQALVVRGLGEVLGGDGAAPTRVVIDGIRNLGEVRWLQHALGDRFSLFAITADPTERFARTKDRFSSSEEFYEADRRDQGEEEDYGQQVNRCVDYADVLIPNEHLEQWQVQSAFRARVTQFAALVEGRHARYANPEEMLMNVAYSATHGSKCLKRQVGAVIALGDEPLASGYNENPTGLKPCIEEFEACFRDIVRHERYELLATSGAKCPYCGEPMQHDLLPPWRCPACLRKLDDAFFPDRAMKWCTALHAEERAIINAAGRDLARTTLYTTTYPCILCAEKIIHVGIRDIVYVEAYPDVHAAVLFKQANVATRRFEGVRSRNFERYFAPIQPLMEKRGEATIRKMIDLP
jgi:deoxycytidylate deaminase/dephospho-CoA kinase